MPDDTLSLLRAGKLAGARRLDLNQGLAEFPREVFDLAETLEVLDLSRNNLTELPEDLGRLAKLRILFCSQNPFRRMPEVLQQCPQLSMVGFKSCEIEEIPPEALPPSLRWLILTDNRLSRLPDALGRCHGLRKLMLSGNRLESLPESMQACTGLELVRLASNRFQALPDWLLQLPRLAWLGIAGNPVTDARSVEFAMPMIDWSRIEFQAQIGEGASGIIHRGRHEGNEVAVKLFKGAMTSDGLPGDEMAAGLAAGQHPQLVGTLGAVANAPDGARGLVMPLMGGEFVPLAGPPSLESCTRDIYPDGLKIAARSLICLARGIASAAEHLHARHILHGDLYAHNILWDRQGQARLGDFGAAALYAAAGEKLGSALQRIEVRAFGVLLEELLQRCEENPPAQVERLKNRCVGPATASCPNFDMIVRELDAMFY